MSDTIIDKMQTWFKQIERQQTVVIANKRSKLSQMFQRWLEERYRVKIAMNEEQIFEKVDPQTKTVLLDRYFQSNIDEIISKLKAKYPRIPIILLTGVKPELEESDLDVDDHIVKPVDRGQLIQKIESVEVSEERVRKLE
jgi:response regulator RpfG family c-di-GMP phosphodiesterase